ncbi:MAG: helix-turn-helix domain-containing protein [Pseudohongiellaceae bacterium]
MKSKDTLSPEAREALLLEWLDAVHGGEMTEGQLLRRVRKEVLDMNQSRYADLAGVSRRTLSDIERDTGQQTVSVLNRVYRPLGLKTGLVLRRR